MSLSVENQARLMAFFERAKANSQQSLGYPVTADFDYSFFSPFLQLALNNVGDPFDDCTYRVESREFEREVVQFFAELFRAPVDDWWGYVTNGGTEGNLYGLYLARENFPKGVVYYSEDTHYSVRKNLHFLNMRHVMLRSQANGEMDYDDLRESIRIYRDVPPIVFANIGTTMTEAKDDLDKIKGIFSELAIGEHYIHADAALCGMTLPFTAHRSAFDFADGADSISISGHKFIGSPMPCGVVLARKRNVDRIARDISYIGSLDTTITGSRNGLTPLILWYAIQRWGKEGFTERVNQCMDTAAYAEQKLREMGVPAWRNPNAITVVFPALHDGLVDRWQLATANGISHIITMPQITQAHIDDFVSDIRQADQPFSESE